MSVVFDFNASLNDVAPVSPFLLSVDLTRMRVNCVWIPRVLFFLSLRSKWSFKSDLFVFNASLNDIAPVSSLLLSVDLVRMEKSGLLMDGICVLFLLSTSQIKLSECCV